MKLKVYIDDREHSEIPAKYKAKPVIDAAAVYCPYVPLNVEIMPDIVELTLPGKFLFRLRCGYDCLSEGGARALEWIEANVPLARYKVFNDIGRHSDLSSFSSLATRYEPERVNIDLLVEFYDKADAALFKLIFL